jgi:hypothetical protein
MKRIRNILLAGAVLAVAAVASLAVASPAKADYGFSYSHTDPSVSCNISKNAYGQVVGRTITITAPVIFSPRTNQQVSYQPYLYHWDGAKWVFDVAAPAIGGVTGSYMLPDSNGFTINAAGKYYRVAIAYRWFWNGGVEASQFTWAGTHTQFITQDLGNSVTSMGYGTTGDWCYMP